MTSPTRSCALLWLGMAALNLTAQPPLASDRPAFEVASIKPNKSSGGPVGSRVQPGGLFTASNVTLEFLLASAYAAPGRMALEGFRVFGAPAWAGVDRYDIQAKAAGTVSMQQLASMLQALLADRFKLVVHHEVRELPVYALMVARTDGKFGAGLRAGESDCHDGPFVSGQARPVPCAPDYGPAGRVIARSIDMPTLATNLSYRVNRVVLDKTGLTGVYAVDLKWTPDPSEFTNSPLGPPPTRSPLEASGAASDGPSLFTALQEQLGLKLQSTKGPVDVIVIDHAEKPTEN
jgi:uncharacterized protein (TIGR03435 family)